MSENRYVTTKQTAKILINSGILSKKTNYPDQAVKRLVKQGLLKGIPPRPEYPKEGYKIDVDSIESYIELGKLKPSELINLVLELKDENTKLKEKLQNKNKENDKPIEIKKTHTRFTTTQYKVNNQLPCPLCDKWYSGNSFGKHTKKQHDLTPKEILTSHKEKVEQMIKEKQK